MRSERTLARKSAWLPGTATLPTPELSCPAELSTAGPGAGGSSGGAFLAQAPNAMTAVARTSVLRTVLIERLLLVCGAIQTTQTRPHGESAGLKDTVPKRPRSET